MAKFKNVPQVFLFHKLLEYWGNMVKNYDDECRDDDFFAVVRNCFDHDKAEKLIEGAYTAKEIEGLENAKLRSLRLDLSDPLDEIFCALWNCKRLRGKCRKVLAAIRTSMRADSSEKDGDMIERRLRDLSGAMKLDELETEVLTLAYVRDQTCFSWPMRIDDREKPIYYAMALDRSYAEVLQAMSQKGKLRKFNLLDNDFDFSSRTIGGYMDGSSSDAFDRRFYGIGEEKDVLPWSFYGDIAAKDGEIIKRIINAGNGHCNVLLYGAPGTGKSSFARSLAKELGRTAFEIGQGDDDGKNMKAEARMIGIHVCNEQESPPESLMVIDEADELLRGSTCGHSLFGFDSRGGKSTEKGVTNTLLDEMKMPAIWISNAPAGAMDESVRRRFDYSVCFERLNNVQRMAIWHNQIAKHGLEALISETKIAEYASKYATNAGGISTVLANVKRMVPTADNIDELVGVFMKPHCKLMGIDSVNGVHQAKDYAIDGLNIKSKVPLERIEKAIGNYLDGDFNMQSEDKPRMNLLLFGPPGTGKTAWVHHLGHLFGRNVLVVKGSDILGKYVGESEQNIAMAFRRAEAERAILFFDEIDGLLRDRSSADHGWEVTQVNELLQQMENFDGIMVAATNFSKNLDPATMRRFTFKVEFGYLEDAGKRLFFERMFKVSLAEDEFSELRQLHNLTPGDFRTVRQSQYYLGDDITNADRIAALKEECEMKNDGSCRNPIGFM